MKFSIYGKYVAIVTELGFRIFKFPDELVNNEELIIREEESFPYFKRLTDLDFMGETLFLALAVRDLGVVIWDEINKTTLKVANIFFNLIRNIQLLIATLIKSACSMSI